MGCGSENGRELLDLAINMPTVAEARCAAVLHNAPTLEEEIWARRARGVALRALGRLDEAHAELNHAFELATSGSDLWAGCAISLSAVLMFRGRVKEGADLLEKALEVSTGMTNAEAWLQKGTFNMAIGNHAAAFAALNTALPKVREFGRTQWEADLLNHRGVVQIFEGRSRTALADFDESIALAAPHGKSLAAAMARCNKALALFRTGDLRGSLDLFASTAHEYESLGLTVHDIAADWSEALLAAGMFEQAIEVTGAAAQHFAATGFVWGTMQCCAIGAEAAYAAGRSDVVSAIGARARNTEGAAGFDGWLARCELAVLQARLQAAGKDRPLPASAVELRKRLTTSGQADAAIDAALTVADLTRQTSSETSADLLADLRLAIARAPLLQQIHWWSLLAEVRSDNGDARSALRAVQTAHRRVEALLTTSASFEVRSHAHAHTKRATETGVAIHIERGNAKQVVELTERQRGHSLLWAPIHASSQTAELRSALDRLRHAEALERSLTTESTSKRPQLATLRRHVVDLVRRQGSESPTGASTLPERPKLKADECVLTYVESGSLLYRVFESDGRARLDTAGAVASVGRLAARLAELERRLSRRLGLSSRVVQSLTVEHASLAAELGDLLVPDDLGHRVVVNPSPTIQGLSWGSLPALRERAHCIAPAFAVANRPLPAPPFRTAAWAASELTHSVTEAHTVAAIHRATSEVNPGRAVLTGLGDHAIVHVAGHFLADGANPLFSHVRLGELDLSGYDLLAAAGTTPILILSSCSSAQAQHQGAGPYGFATAALAAGTSSVFASQAPIEDGEAIIKAMSRIHTSLAAGRPPAEALLDARLAARSEDGFLVGAISVLGTGW